MTKNSNTELRDFFCNQFDKKNSDYYKLLNVKQNATFRQIDTAFSSISERYQGRFKKLNEAYVTLSDSWLRATYDALHPIYKKDNDILAKYLRKFLNLKKDDCDVFVIKDENAPQIFVALRNKEKLGDICMYLKSIGLRAFIRPPNDFLPQEELVIGESLADAVKKLKLVLNTKGLYNNSMLAAIHDAKEVNRKEDLEKKHPEVECLIPSKMSL